MFARFFKWTIQHIEKPLTEMCIITDQEKETALALKEAVVQQLGNMLTIDRIRAFLYASFHQVKKNLRGPSFNTLFFCRSLVLDVDEGVEKVVSGYSSMVAMMVYWGRVSVLDAMYHLDGYE